MSVMKGLERKEIKEERGESMSKIWKDVYKTEINHK